MPERPAAIAESSTPKPLLAESTTTFARFFGAAMSAAVHGGSESHLLGAGREFHGFVEVHRAGGIAGGFAVQRVADLRSRRGGRAPAPACISPRG
jgi:hypothetical protein